MSNENLKELVGKKVVLNMGNTISINTYLT